MQNSTKLNKYHGNSHKIIDSDHKQRLRIIFMAFQEKNSSKQACTGNHAKTVQNSSCFSWQFMAYSLKNLPIPRTSPYLGFWMNLDEKKQDFDGEKWRIERASSAVQNSPSSTCFLSFSRFLSFLAVFLSFSCLLLLLGGRWLLVVQGWRVEAS